MNNMQKITGHLINASIIENAQINMLRRMIVEYNYVVGKNQYTGNKVIVTDYAPYLIPNYVESLAYKFRQWSLKNNNNEIDVYYDSKKPANAVLSLKRVTGKQWFKLFLLVFVTTAISIYIGSKIEFLKLLFSFPICMIGAIIINNFSKKAFLRNPGVGVRPIF